MHEIMEIEKPFLYSNTGLTSAMMKCEIILSSYGVGCRRETFEYLGTILSTKTSKFVQGHKAAYSKLQIAYVAQLRMASNIAGMALLSQAMS